MPEDYNIASCWARSFSVGALAKGLLAPGHFGAFTFENVEDGDDLNTWVFPLPEVAFVETRGGFGDPGRRRDLHLG